MTDVNGAAPGASLQRIIEVGPSGWVFTLTRKRRYRWLTAMATQQAGSDVVVADTEAASTVTRDDAGFQPPTTGPFP